MAVSTSASLAEETFSFAGAVFGCDYVIHQGITIKKKGSGRGVGCVVGGGQGVEGLEGNSVATDDHRLATAQGQECFVRRCVRQVARRR